MLRRLLRLSAAALVGLLVFIGPAQPAQAGGAYPACGVTCDGKDPAYWRWYPFGNKTYINCGNDAVTVGSVQYYPWKVELRYSNNCETTWARKTFLGGGNYLPEDVIHKSYYLNGVLRASVNNGFVANTNWTTMLDDHSLSNKACLEVFLNEDDYVNDNPVFSGCTASY